MVTKIRCPAYCTRVYCTQGQYVRRWLADVKAMRLTRSFALIAVLTGACWSSIALTGDVLPPSVLIINQANSYRPWPRAIINEIRQVMDVRFGGSALVYVEDLDLYRFNGTDFEKITEQYLRQKYLNKPISVIVSIGPAGFEFALRVRDSVWPGMPIVFSAVDKKLSDLTSNSKVTGITIQFTLADMITAARLVLPKTQRFALVGDPLDKQLYYSQFVEELAENSKRYQFIDLMGLPLDEVKRRVSELPDNTAILYIGINSSLGVSYVSAEVVPLLVEVANRPIIVSVETYFGTGALGGFILSPRDVGREAGQLALRVLKGEDASTIPVTASGSLRPLFDWRQLQRWGVSEKALPAGSDVRFRDPDVWDQYGREIIIACGVLLLQSVMIAVLIVERYRRRSAEQVSRNRLRQVIHLNRTATAGALSAAVAHELNQPLGAILNYAETAEILLSKKSPNLPLLKEIISDIRRDNQRASEVIKHMRDLLKERSEGELATFDLNDAVDAAVRIYAAEAAKRDIALDTVQSNTAFPVRADQVQVQQVILNLLANGMDAVSSCAPNQRRLMIQAIQSGASDVEVLVSDSGTGISKEALKSIFEAFYTTKANGIGLGLSIARTIVEAYGGKIWAQNRSGGGAVFRFTLPLAS